MTTVPWRSAASALGALLLVSCILVVSPERYGDRCRLADGDSQCGACVVARCQTALDDCCLDDACGETLHAVETCASQHDTRCATAKDPARGPLAKCVAESCGGVCVPLTGAPSTTCREPPIAEGGSCTCRYAGPAAGNDFVCNGAAYAETICCAPQGWPAAGQECVCRSIDCTPKSDGCSCIAIEHGSRQSECSGRVCCSQNDSCSCGSRACFPGFEKTVPSCNLAQLGCARNQVRVDSCSLRAP